MSDDLLESMEPPDRNDFQRMGKGIPRVIDPESGKRVSFRRSSSVGKILDDESNLWDWKMRTQVLGAAYRPELMAQASTLDPDANKKELRDIAEKCLEAGRGTRRSIQGTAVHSMFDHVDLEHDWDPAPQFRTLVEAYVHALAFYGLVSEEVEVRCVNDTYRLAGTLDRRYRTTRQLVCPDGQIIPIGSYVLGDTKTGESLEYASGTYVTQLAVYCDSLRYDPATDERSPFHPPTFPDWALIIHAVPERESVDIYWADLNAGRQGLELAQRIYEWRRRTDLITPAVAPLRAVPQPESPPEPPTEPQDVSEPALAPDTPEPEPEPISEALYAELHEWLRGRVIAVREHSEVAAKHLQRLWPEGVPGLKMTGQTLEQLDAIEQALNGIEKDYSVPFGATDPRIKQSIKNHPSWADRWSQPKNDDPPAPQVGRDAIADGISNHPRRLLLAAWSARAMSNLDPAITDRTALAHALYEFASIGPEADWSDDDLTTMLSGTLNALGYPAGVHDLGRVQAEDAPKIMSAAFAITSGNAMLLFDERNMPVVRFNVQTADKQRKGRTDD